MRCQKCQFGNPDDAKFCMECGNHLTVAAPQFEKPVVETERKHATVLFSDLSGYTALTEKLDPEEVKEIMGLIFREIGRLTKSYDGTIERFFGDEVLLLFGVPNRERPQGLSICYAKFCLLGQKSSVCRTEIRISLKEAIEAAKKVGAIATLSQAYLDIALLYKAKKRVD